MKYNDILKVLAEKEKKSKVLYYIKDEDGLFFYGKKADHRNGYDSKQAQGFEKKKDAQDKQKKLGRNTSVLSKTVDNINSDNTFTV